MVSLHIHPLLQVHELVLLLHHHHHRAHVHLHPLQDHVVVLLLLLLLVHVEAHLLHLPHLGHQVHHHLHQPMVKLTQEDHCQMEEEVVDSHVLQPQMQHVWHPVGHR